MSRTHSPGGGDAASAGLDVDPSQASALLSALSGFLTVAVHCILHARSLYPPATFITARAYNLPVHQSRHPGVCAWVKDAVAAAEAQVRYGAAQNVVLNIHLAETVLERWVFDMSSLPSSWGAAKPDDADVNWTDVHQGFRGALSRLTAVGARLAPLPDGCSFSLTVELRDAAEAPIQVSPADMHCASAERFYSTRSFGFLQAACIRPRQAPALPSAQPPPCGPSAPVHYFSSVGSSG